MSYRETFQLNSVSMSAVLNATLSAIEDLGWQITGGNSAGTLVTARTPFSVWSSGETVRITFRPLESAVEVDVRSSVHWQVLSWGRNADNVARLRLSLEHQFLMTSAQEPQPTEPPPSIAAPEPAPAPPTVAANTAAPPAPLTVPANTAPSEEVRTLASSPSARYCYSCGTALDFLNTNEVKCHLCDQPIPAHAKFCSYCGVSTIEQCSSCGSRFKAGDLFCGHCGTKRTPAQTAASSSAK